MIKSKSLSFKAAVSPFFPVGLSLSPMITVGAVLEIITLLFFPSTTVSIIPPHIFVFHALFFGTELLLNSLFYNCIGKAHNADSYLNAPLQFHLCATCKQKKLIFEGSSYTLHLSLLPRSH